MVPPFFKMLVVRKYKPAKEECRHGFFRIEVGLIANICGTKEMSMFDDGAAPQKCEYLTFGALPIGGPFLG